MPTQEMIDKLRPEWLRTAHHEVGHGIAASVLGIGAEHARIWYSGWGSSTRVQGVMRPVGSDVRFPDEATAAAWAVMALAGAAAEIAFVRRVEGASGGTAVWIVDGPSAVDRSNARRYLRHAGVGYGEARTRAEQLVRAHWRHIEKAARVLARRGYVPSSALKV